MKSKNLQHDDTFLNNQDEVNAFKQRIEDENLILEGQPYFISSEDMLKSGYLPHDSYDSHIRLYEKPNSQNGVRVIYVPELEWEPDKVKQRY